MRKIGYVTYADNPKDPDPDLDIPILIPAIEDLGVTVELVDWQKEQSLEDFDLLVIRSPWNYAQNLESFITWLEKANQEVKIINPIEVIKANINKRYLMDLHALGVSIISTKVIESVKDLDGIDFDSIRTVFKPVVGAGARGAFVVDSAPEAISQATKHFHTSSTPLLMQPYLPEVDLAGEIAVVCCKGELMHAVIKRPALSDGGHGDFAANTLITSELANFVNEIMQLHVAGTKISDLVYARVDVVPVDSGFQLMELELIEPFLFLPMNVNSASKFAKAIVESI